jgi:hypothetical protein
MASVPLMPPDSRPVVSRVSYDPSLVSRCLDVFIAFLTKNQMNSPDRAINLTDIIPMIRVDVVELRDRPTTGLATAILREGVYRGVLGQVGTQVYAIKVDQNPVPIPRLEQKDSPANESFESLDKHESISLEPTRRRRKYEQALRDRGVWISPFTMDELCCGCEAFSKERANLTDPFFGGDLEAYLVRHLLKADKRYENGAHVLARRFRKVLLEANAINEERTAGSGKLVPRYRTIDQAFRGMIVELQILIVLESMPARSIVLSEKTVCALSKTFFGNATYNCVIKIDTAVQSIIRRGDATLDDDRTLRRQDRPTLGLADRTAG